jgi:hypothetical protein
MDAAGAAPSRESGGARSGQASDRGQAGRRWDGRHRHLARWQVGATQLRWAWPRAAVGPGNRSRCGGNRSAGSQHGRCVKKVVPYPDRSHRRGNLHTTGFGYTPGGMVISVEPPTRVATRVPPRPAHLRCARCPRVDVGHDAEAAPPPPPWHWRQPDPRAPRMRGRFSLMDQTEALSS